MKLSSIERNPDTKQLEVVFSFNDNLTLAIPIMEDRITIPMIKSAAESLGHRGFKVKIKIVPCWDGCVLLPEDL